ncbi:4-hydroxythreonine-4-phosphate dehydrogenase PdxA [Gammaproteobacteria bacterium AB-CW1]|uniref:4-hydroxythreonine-4-phosphate dehydrogenase n=2 Tax=Natronospira elongata TaxID=3110268 RepID=A0AAP6MM55_9GAMM|nr:4-hydroxythreonine-4-phosphate dehydrogenase PdxA [Gammaproteobacteria bacterium AB-CW1]
MRPLALSAGEPAGIGPDLCLELARESREYPLVVLGDPGVLAARAEQLGYRIDCQTWHGGEVLRTAGRLSIQPVPVRTPVRAGHLDTSNAAHVIDLLTQAVDGCLAGHFSALVTAPVHKGVINDAGIPFSGHTEFLAERTGGKQPVMMLACPGLRVALATTHLPLREVADTISSERLETIIRILDQDLRQKFGLSAARILVLGLNPHAGEGGHLGREELDIIEPLLSRLRSEGFSLDGPLPADTAFTPRHLDQADAVLAMYHDQGLPVLKYAGFGNAVNITLGLPIIRTSVDHGTALDLAGSGKAEAGSLRAAVESALEMVEAKA